MHIPVPGGYRLRGGAGAKTPHNNYTSGLWYTNKETNFTLLEHSVCSLSCPSGAARQNLLFWTIQTTLFHKNNNNKNYNTNQLSEKRFVSKLTGRGGSAARLLLLVGPARGTATKAS
jgi:hypothetical protein